MRGYLKLVAWGVMLVMFGTGHVVAEEGGEPAGQTRKAEATFAGGCFWCMEHPFDEEVGVLETISGYTGGTKERPSYAEVSSGTTGHAEAVRVVYDPDRVSYARLVDIFWHNVDPVDAGGQFCDRGSQYRSGIFYHDDEQRSIAEKSRAALDASGRLPGPVVTQIVPAGPFWPAEAYHQDYSSRNPLRYRFYRHGCGRDARLEELWGKP
ncbi:peptide-methionine (S)-S-oxide reductase [Desulfobaculum xiamenense]|uniref:Peptide methionine sulfoxide reductase MsrA n=1 Tax=Desulfobaculum xiamenense TaxID=995050 RepID=A0A846QLX9_9BACT|nr:peptide-methionine (S)-S-oxide reductase MsrA [Desulfobaculum xiamenense]NJB69111.1 peptide-methionine (S)-S-oxide reductase [Desulfobaculum xiamenense]